jgi:hypothetical protein
MTYDTYLLCAYAVQKLQLGYFCSCGSRVVLDLLLLLRHI